MSEAEIKARIDEIEDARKKIVAIIGELQIAQGFTVLSSVSVDLAMGAGLSKELFVRGMSESYDTRARNIARAKN